MYLLIKSSILKITSIILAGIFFTLWCPSLVAKAQISNNGQTLKKLELFADIFYQIRENYVDEIDEQYNLENNFEESSCNEDQEFLDLDKVDFDITPTV